MVRTTSGTGLLIAIHLLSYSGWAVAQSQGLAGGEDANGAQRRQVSTDDCPNDSTKGVILCEAGERECPDEHECVEFLGCNQGICVGSQTAKCVPRASHGGWETPCASRLNCGEDADWPYKKCYKKAGCDIGYCAYAKSQAELDKMGAAKDSGKSTNAGNAKKGGECKVADKDLGKQDNWRWDRRSQNLIYNGQGAISPAGGAPDLSGSANYVMYYVPPGCTYSGKGQDNWRWDKKSHNLMFAGSSAAVSPAGGAPDFSGSHNYVMYFETNGKTPLKAGTFQTDWKWDKKSQHLVFTKSSKPVSAAGGDVDTTGSANYILEMKK